MTGPNRGPLTYDVNTTGVFAGGTAQAILNGPPPFRQWTVTGSQITTTSAAQTTFKLYRNIVAPATLVGQSFTGNQDGSIGSTILKPGESLVAVWTGGTPGAVATLVASILDEPMGGN